MSNLESAILYCLRSAGSTYHYGSSTFLPATPRAVQMVIPIHKDKPFEIPAFALFALRDEPNLPDMDAVTVMLEVSPHISRYKSLDARIRDLLPLNYTSNKIWCLGEEGDPARMYYATQGVIFDYMLNPVMMFSWQVEVVHEEGEPDKLRRLRPILRVLPHVFTSKIDKVQRFICNKMVPTALGLGLVYPNHVYSRASWWMSDYKPMPIKVEIDQCPFKMRVTDKPSVSTTNYELRNIALDHMEEVVT